MFKLVLNLHQKIVRSEKLHMSSCMAINFVFCFEKVKLIFKLVLNLHQKVVSSEKLHMSYV